MSGIYQNYYFFVSYANLAQSLFRSQYFSTEWAIAQISDKNFVPFHKLQM